MAVAISFPALGLWQGEAGQPSVYGAFEAIAYASKPVKDGHRKEESRQIAGLPII